MRIIKYSFLILLIYSANLFAQYYTLPIELIYFNFQIVDTTVNLAWGTATEVNSYGFNIERYSNPDSLWETIGFVMGAGVSNSPKNYNFEDTTVIKNKTYFYRLKQIDNDGSFKYSDTLVVSIISEIKKENNLTPKNFFVSQNYPNPFNPTTNIRVEIPEVNEIILKVYDSLGKIVLERNYGEKMPGVYLISFNASNLSSGIYYYSISCGKYFKAQSMVLLK
ncbi:MAG: T9SS type A sorting domain-containing protein [Bacteroidetes bacterium]|nr:T9SS type A sorting domain-containing protein [Bacteroidota bacterium]